MTSAERTEKGFWPTYAVAWLPVTGMYLLGFAFSPRLTFARALTMALVTTGVAALLGIPIWFACRAIVTLSSMPVRLTLFMALGIAFALCHATLFSLLQLASGTSYSAISAVAIWDAQGSLWLYVPMLSCMLAVLAYQRAAEQQSAAARAEVARYDADASRARAELRALRSSLDPHFLFNTLNALGAVLETNPAQARVLLVGTASLLRRVLALGREGRDTVLLADDWAVVKDFLALEQIRMGHRLTIVTSLSEDAMDCRVPAFTLQPLVENAIRHGIFPQPGGGTLSLRADVHGDVLSIAVEDDGVGCSALAPEATSGLGLRAVRQRLAGLHGPSATMRLTTQPGQGFRVELRVPMDVALASATSSTEVGAEGACPHNAVSHA